MKMYANSLYFFGEDKIIINIIIFIINQAEWCMFMNLIFILIFVDAKLCNLRF